MKTEIKVGQKVKVNGYIGAVTVVCAGQLTGMFEVRWYLNGRSHEVCTDDVEVVS